MKTVIEVTKQDEGKFVDITFEATFFLPKVSSGFEDFKNAVATAKKTETFFIETGENVKKRLSDILFARNVDLVDVRILKIEE